MRRFGGRGTRRLLAGVLALWLAAPGLAQPKEEEPFYDVDVKTHVKPYVQWTVAVLFMAGCLLIAFKNPRRTHLD